MRSWIILLSFFLVSSNALWCTTNCTYRFDLSTPFYIPNSCTQTTSAGHCEVDIIINYETKQVTVSFISDRSKYIMNDRSFLFIQFDYVSVSLSNDHKCKNKDDCARAFAMNNAQNILDRLTIDTGSIVSELKPILLSNPPSSTTNTELICYVSNENTGQCSTGNALGECKVIDDLIETKKTSRTCDQDKDSVKKYISIYDSGSFARLTMHGNRSLCNSPKSVEAVKDILFKYNVTISQTGRLRNNARQLSISSLVILISLFYVKIIV